MNRPPITITADTVRPLPLAAYDAERAAMTAALRSVGASAVYEIGSVSAPGISDLDLVACFPDDADLRRSFAPVERLLRPSKAFLHAPWALRERHLPGLPALFAVRQMRELGGGPAVTVVQTAAQRFLWNTEACASVLAALVARRSLTTRSAACLLNGVRYNVELAATDGITAPTGEAFCQRIAALRRDWFTLPAAAREQETVALWDAAEVVVRSLLAGCAAYVRARSTGAATDASMRVPGANTTFYFTDGGAPRLLLSQPLASIVQLPRDLGPLFALLAAPGGGLDRWLAVQPGAPGPAPRFDPTFAAAVRAYARDNTAYLADQLAQPLPFLLLCGGTLNHVRTTPAVRIMNLLRRARARLLPARG
jgi:hypothetical protein